jgi:RNA polymerase sigma factor (sigma-70 family)
MKPLQNEALAAPLDSTDVESKVIPFSVNKKADPSNRSVLAPVDERERLQMVSEFRAMLDAILTHSSFDRHTLALVVAKKMPTQGVSNRERLRALLIEPKQELCLQVLDSFSGQLLFETADQLLRRFGVEQSLERPRDLHLSQKATRRVLDRLSFYIKRDYARYKRAQRDLFEHHYGLVIELAKEHCSGKTALFDDAIQEGALGLLQAIDKAEVRTDSNFSGYAVCWIRKAITDLQSGNRYSLYVPINFVRMIRKIQNRFSEQQTETSDPNPEQFAAKQGLTIEALQAFVTLQQGSVSIHEPIGEGEETREEIIADHSQPTPATLTARKDAREYLQRAVNYLTPQQRTVLLLRFGLGEDSETYSQSEVAKRVGICPQRVSKLERAAMDSLRKTHKVHLRDILSSDM